MAEKNVEFMVDSVAEESGFLRVRGACNKGTLSIGDKFNEAYRHELEQDSDGGYHVSKQYDQRNVALTVEKIRVYGREIDELTEGMTAELLLSGQRADLVKEGDLLANG